MDWIDDLKNVGLQYYDAEIPRIFCELSKNSISIGNTVPSEASAEALIIAVAAMIEENNKVLLSEIS